MMSYKVQYNGSTQNYNIGRPKNINWSLLHLIDKNG